MFLFLLLWYNLQSKADRLPSLKLCHLSYTVLRISGGEPLIEKKKKHHILILIFYGSIDLSVWNKLAYLNGKAVCCYSGNETTMTIGYGTWLFQSSIPTAPPSSRVITNTNFLLPWFSTSKICIFHGTSVIHLVVFEPQSTAAKNNPYLQIMPLAFWFLKTVFWFPHLNCAIKLVLLHFFP